MIKALRRIFTHSIRTLIKRNPLAISISKRALERVFYKGLPNEFREGLTFLLTGNTDDNTVKLADKIEGIRKSIAVQGNKKVPIWYSPKPDSSGNKVTPDLRPSPGKILEFTMERIARTGKNRRWGIFLYLLEKAYQSRTIFELGSCAGISGCYLAAPDSVETFITVEGSTELAKIAEGNIYKVSPRAKVINSLFDDAIDQQLPNLNSSLDFVFIDGHHEKIASIHYYERIIPYLNSRAIIVFDDVSWSHDMREAWNELSSRTEFSHALDLGDIGVCVYDEYLSNEKQTYWDLRWIVGRKAIGEPNEWKE